MGIFSKFKKMSAMNGDPDQQVLAQLFVDYAEARTSGPAARSQGQPTDLTTDERSLVERIFAFLEERRWPRAEREERIAHAISMVRVWRPNLFEVAKNVGQLIIVGGRQPEQSANRVAPMSMEQMERVSDEIITLLQKSGVQSMERGIEVLLITTVRLIKGLTAPAAREQINRTKALLSGLERSYTGD